jgi:HupE / UreJ protein
MTECRNSCSWGRRKILLVFSIAFISVPAWAHSPKVALAIITIEDDGRFSLNLTFDLPPFIFQVLPSKANDNVLNAWLDGSTEALIAGLAAAQARFQKEFTVTSDGVPGTIDTLTFPTVADVVRYRESPPTPRLPAMLMLSLEGHLPPRAHSVSFRFPSKLGDILGTVNLPNQAPIALLVNSDGITPPIPVQLTDATSTARSKVVITSSAQLVPGRWPVVWQYLKLGFSHILPEGTDHILFVLGLFLLSCRIKPLLWQVTAFTLAHSITLGLSMYGVIRLPTQIVEPLIALSIVFVAAENICTTELKPWRLAVVFCFGLIHGLGFSSVLLSLGLPRTQFLPALLAFNSGVELGQLAVISAAFLCVGWWRNREWYRRVIVVPASTIIAFTGLLWTFQRVAATIR